MMSREKIINKNIKSERMPRVSETEDNQIWLGCMKRSNEVCKAG